MPPILMPHSAHFQILFLVVNKNKKNKWGNRNEGKWCFYYEIECNGIFKITRVWGKIEQEYSFIQRKESIIFEMNFAICATQKE